MADHPPAPRPPSRCFVCGEENPRGLRLRFTADGAGVSAEWIPAPYLEGFEGIVHGGIVSTVLDEAMSKAVAERGWRALTCELRVRLRKRVRPGETFRIRGWVSERRRRRILTEAVLESPGGEEHAHAWAAFLAAAGEAS